jgi:hypothetical protein
MTVMKMIDDDYNHNDDDDDDNNNNNNNNNKYIDKVGAFESHGQSSKFNYYHIPTNALIISFIISNRF